VTISKRIPPETASTGGLSTDSAGHYTAFMSYSHALDGVLAPALQSSLEQFGRVWFRRRAIRIFRDATNLAATPHLWESIEQALRSSEWLVLLASPESARSRWVQREVDWWLAHRSPERLLVVVTDGSIMWEEVTGTVDEERTDALPPAFAALKFPEPLWVDLRPLRVAEPTDPAYHAAVVDISATLQGRPKDDLVGEQIRQHRKRRRFIALAAVTLVLLTLTSIVAAGMAAAQRDRAENQTRVATARLLLTQAQAIVAADPRTALLLGEAAQHIHPDPEIRSGLAELLRGTRYLGTLTGHTGPVTTVAFGGERPLLATGSTDGTAMLWDLSGPAGPRRIGQPLTGHTRDPDDSLWGAVNSVALAADGRTLATAGDDQTVILWDVSDPARPHRIGEPLAGHSDWVNSVAFAPDGRTLATGGRDSSVILWDVSDPARPRRVGPLVRHTASVNSVAFAPDGRTLATAGEDKAMILWDVSDPTGLRRIGEPVGHDDWVHSVAFAPDGRILASGSDDGSVILWDVSNPARPQRVGPPLTGHGDPLYNRTSPATSLPDSSVNSVAFAPDGRTLATAGHDKAVILWDVSDPASPHRIGQSLTSHTGFVRAVAFAPDGTGLVSGSVDATVIRWDLTDPAHPRRIGELLTGHALALDATALSPDGHLLATGSDDRTVLLWDLSDPARPRQTAAPLAHGERVTAVAFAPEGRVLVSGSDAGYVTLWDVSDPTRPQRIGEPIIRHALFADRNVVHSVAFTPDGRILAFGNRDGSVALWDLSDLARPRWIGEALEGFEMAFTMALSPDGHTLAIDAGTTVELWDLTDPAHPRRIAQPPTSNTDVLSVAFSPDGHTLAIGAGTTVELWDLTEPARPRRIAQPLPSNTDVLSVAFSPDGRTVAASTNDAAVTLWDVTDLGRPKQIGERLAAHTALVRGLEFTPDRRTLVTGGGDGTVMVWDIGGLTFLNDHALEIACARTAGALDQAEWTRLVDGLPYENACAAV
jgi:WD40 repeat protein